MQLQPIATIKKYKCLNDRTISVAAISLNDISEQLDELYNKYNAITAMVDLVKTCGVTPNIKQYLRKQTDLDSIVSFESLSIDTDILAVLDHQRKETAIAFDIAMEGFWSNIGRTFQHMFTRDLKCAEILNEAISRFEQMSKESKEGFINKKVTFWFFEKKDLDTLISICSEMTMFLKQNRDVIEELDRWFANLRDKSMMYTYRLNDQFLKRKKELKDKIYKVQKLVESAYEDSTKSFKDYGYTVDSLLTLMKKFARESSGNYLLFKQLNGAIFSNCREITDVNCHSDGRVDIKTDYRAVFRFLATCAEAGSTAYINTDFVFFRIAKMIK